MGAWTYSLKPRWPWYLLGTFAIGVATAAELFIPRVLQTLIDGWTASTLFTDALKILVLALAVRFLTSWIARGILGAEAASALSAARTNSIREAITVRRRLDAGAPPLASRLVAEGRAAHFLLGPAYLFGGTLLVNFVVSTIFLFLLFPGPAFLCLFLWPVLHLLLNRNAEAEKSAHGQAQRFLFVLSERIERVLGSIAEHKLAGTGRLVRTSLLNASEEYRAATWRGRRLAVRTEAIALGSAALLSASLLVWLVREVWVGHATTGGLFAFLTYLAIATGAMGQLGMFLSAVRRARIGLDGFATASPRPNEKQSLKTSEPVYRVDEVSISLSPTGSSLSLLLQQGERVALRGAVGSGKTSLLRLLSGAVAPYHGRIEFLGEDMRSVDQETISQTVAYVPQHPALFSGTLRENLALEGSLSDSALWKRLEWVGLAEEIRGFPSQLETKVGEGGLGLSTGQQQRLALARALCRDRLVYLLDDCLSGVPPSLGKGIVARVLAELKDKIVVMAGHNEWFLEACVRSVIFDGTWMRSEGASA